MAALSYSDYLHLDAILGAQHPLSDPVEHDELLFIVQHQTSELWLKLLLHELLAARRLLTEDDVPVALKCLARVKRILLTLIEQWNVLATLTPSEYARFRTVLQSSSGFQSWQYRAVEFLLGNKDDAMRAHFADEPAAQAVLSQLWEEPTLYDAFLQLLARRDHRIPPAIVERDVRVGWQLHADLIEPLGRIYREPGRYWSEYDMCESLLDVEDGIAQWRFRHLKTVERIIGSAPGTGGTSGLPYLRQALDRGFFPELYAVRARVLAAPGSPGPSRPGA